MIDKILVLRPFVPRPIYIERIKTLNYPKLVITMDEYGSGSNLNGVVQLHLRDFLVNNNL